MSNEQKMESKDCNFIMKIFVFSVLFMIKEISTKFVENNYHDDYQLKATGK